MRTFGKDTPEFFEFKIAGKKKVYKIPTQSSLSYDLLSELVNISTIENQLEQNAAAMNLQMKILEKYVGEDAHDFSADAVADMFSEWATYSSETSGVEQGE